MKTKIKWLWGAAIAGVIIITVFVANSQLQRGRLPFPSAEERAILTKPMKKLPDLVVKELNYPTGYVVIENIGEFPVTKSFATKVTMPCFGSTSVQTFVTRALNIGTPVRYNFDPNKTCKTTQITAFVDSNKTVAESDESNNVLVINTTAPVVTPSEARCKQLKMWADQGVLTQNIGGNWAEVTACQNTYGQFYVTANLCAQYKVWRDQGNLTPNMGGNADAARACATYYPNVWNSPPLGRARCTQLQLWAEQGVLSQNLGGNYWEMEECRLRYAPLGLVNTQRCTVLKLWLDQGVLTRNLGNNLTEAEACNAYYQDIWNGPSQARCKQLHDWYEQGVLTRNLGGNIWEATACQNQWPDHFWVTSSRCKQLKQWLDQGVLSQNIQDPKEANACELYYPNIWHASSPTPPPGGQSQPPQSEPYPSPSFPPLTIIYPASGQGWGLGSQLPIRWSGGSPNWKVNLILNNAAKTQTVLIIDQNTANTPFGVAWSIPTNLAPGQYTVRVACSSGPTVCPATGWYADSGVFSILALSQPRF